MDVHGKQMLLVRCGDHLNFEATIPTDTPAVKKKVNFWKQYQQQQFGSTSTDNERHPISILLLGMDSVSRSHAYRSLPHTLDYMTSQMDFIDFQGYHSAYFNTTSNFMAFLIGLTVYGARDVCGGNTYDPETIWNPCPFIWKKFDEAQYVTMYIEDGYKTLVSFKEPPTDYYLFPLFSAASYLRRQRQISSRSNSWGDYCMSNESVPQFMLRYTRRFVDKFNPISKTSKTKPPRPPFFAFTYLADPFHDELYALPTMDQEFLQLMHHLNSERLRPLLESTLIVFLGDHGDRNNFFRSDSMEAYIERSMPPFFVRVPEQFRTRFPDYAEVLKWNAANRLVTPFDLHHTMLHLLHLNSPNIKKKDEFVPVWGNRSSLFHRVGGNRTCDLLNLPRCVCNMSLNSEHFTDPSALRQLIQFVEARLNQFVLESGFQDICAKWTTAGLESLLSARILPKELHKTDRWSPLGIPWLTLVVLLKFKANPLEAVFEAKVRVQLDVLGDWEEQGAEIMGDFTRISIYGRQSECFKVKTARDKKMKELCVCKNYGPAPK